MENRCPRCKELINIRVWKNRKFCKSCNYSWTKGIKNIYKGEVECPDCGSIKIKIRDSKLVKEKEKKKKTRRKRFQCNECGATWWENSFIKIRPSERKEWIRWIRNEYKNGMSLKKIKDYIREVTGLADRSVSYLINQAIGDRKKTITKKDIEKALYWRSQGVKCKDIERLVGFKWKSIHAKAKQYGMLPKKNE